MKTATVYQKKHVMVPFPNAATPRQMVHKILDGLLMAASGVGIGAIVLLALAIF